MNRQPPHAVAPTLVPGAIARRAGTPFAVEWAPPLRLLIEDLPSPDPDPDPVSLGLCRRHRAFSDRIASAQQGGVLLVQGLNEPRLLDALAQDTAGPTLLHAQSVHLLARLVRDHAWQPLVRRAGTVQAAFVVPDHSPLHSLADTRGARFLMPPPEASATGLACAALRRAGIAAPRMHHVSYAQAVLAMVACGAYDVAVADLRELPAGWGRVLALTPAVADACVAASPEVAPELARAVTDALLSLTHPPAAVAPPDLGAARPWVRTGRDEYLHLLAGLDG